ncbi:MAG: glycosyltransferase [Jatrophihabitantaceae bacterium]
MITAPTSLRPVFDHLARLTDDRALFEHALHTDPRPEHGYCIDDAARALAVICRESDPSTQLVELTERYLSFTLSAVQPDGSCHNRMNVAGNWTDASGVGDWWGRALWGLSAAACRAPTSDMRARALTGFRLAAARRSPHQRAMTFAALGAGELLLARPGEASARTLLRDCVTAIGPASVDPAWPWPQPRLTYANGSVVEALLLAGQVLADGGIGVQALTLLEFLLATETHDGHLSVTPVGGRGPGERPPAFDQQPIEVATLADACARAFEVTGDSRWLEGVRSAWSWFLGNNDSMTLMYDPTTGGGYDGLERGGRNANQGAESTLAVLSTHQHVHRLVHG